MTGLADAFAQWCWGQLGHEAGPCPVVLPHIDRPVGDLTLLCVVRAPHEDPDLPLVGLYSLPERDLNGERSDEAFLAHNRLVYVETREQAREVVVALQEVFGL